MRKSISLLLTVLLVLMCIPTALSAGEPTIIASTANGRVGSTVHVDISLRDNPGITMANIKIQYSSSIVELISAENGTVFSANNALYSFSPNITDNPYSACWISAEHANITNNGALIKLQFKIKDSAPIGAVSPIIVSYDTCDITNVNLSPVSFNIINGSIIVAQNTTMHFVTFIDGYDGSVISTIEVEDGASAIFPSAPNHISDGYEFAGWSDYAQYVTSDMTVTANYRRISHKVTFIDGYDNSVISEINVLHGDAASFPSVPNHLPEGYFFRGWDNGGSNITEDTIITALYRELVHTVTFVDGYTNRTISTIQVDHYANAVFPTPPNHDNINYCFSQWSDNGENITSDMTITAIYVKLGDANGDDSVNTGDAVAILRDTVGISHIDENYTTAADVNRDGSVNTGDAVAVLRIVVGGN